MIKTLEERLSEKIEAAAKENRELKTQLAVTQSALDAVLMGELEEAEEV